MDSDGVRHRVRDGARGTVTEPGVPAPDPLVAARQFQILARRAEAAQLTAMLEHQDALEAEERLAELPLHARREARKVPVRQLALELRMSERTVAVLLGCARFARRELPQTWRVFGEGAVYQQRLRLVADAAMSLESAEHVEALDAAAEKKAPESTATQLRRWLNRFVARLGPEEFARSCEQAQRHRHVRLQHLENGVSLLQALLPTVQAAAIEKRLRAAARGLDGPQPRDPEAAETPAPSPDLMSTGSGPACSDHTDSAPQPHDLQPHDPRTLDQREADLLAAWLLDGRVGGTPVEAALAIMVPEVTLTGESNEPAVSADGAWAIPAQAVRELAFAPGAQHRWYEAVTRRPSSAEDDVLQIRYQGRFAPQRLRDAVAFRDRTCRAEGCSVPAEHCDLDHRIPWPKGPTTGTNLQALCRRHHRMKSHGYLDPPDAVAGR